MNRLVAVLAAFAIVGVAAACSSSPLTADEWAWCQHHWRDGLDSSQRNEPQGSTWYFNHMGMRDDPDTIGVCRAAASKR